MIVEGLIRYPRELNEVTYEHPKRKKEKYTVGRVNTSCMVVTMIFSEKCSSISKNYIKFQK